MDVGSGVYMTRVQKVILHPQRTEYRRQRTEKSDIYNKSVGAKTRVCHFFAVASYIYQLHIGAQVETRKLVLIR